MAARFSYEIDAPVNERFRKATINVRNKKKEIVTTDTANMVSLEERAKLVRRLARRLDENADEVKGKIESAWQQVLVERQNLEAEREEVRQSGSDAIVTEILDARPAAIRRPLCLIDGKAYAAAWLHVQITVTQEVNRETGQIAYFDPPEVRCQPVLAILRSDGQVYCDGPGFDAALPLAQLGLTVTLPSAPTPERCWSGAGVKRFVARERPSPADVFRRVVRVADRFVDFAQSLSDAPQDIMPQMVACYVLGTYLLDAFHVTGYLWPNGDRGTGKTTFLHVIGETSYLGHVILAGGSFAALRDLADYGATLCFDDAEGIMDVRHGDPDKRSLLLAGNRRGAHVTVKEQVGERWETRHVHTFCPRAFSAIRLPDEVLGSRSIIVPLVRSVDATRAKANPLDHAAWPCDRRRLLDDLWSLGLAYLPELPQFDALAAERAKLMGRDLEPWRVIFGVALWLQERHKVEGLFDRMSKLADAYQKERAELDSGDPTPIAIRALQSMLGNDERMTVVPKNLADWMNKIAIEEDLAEQGENARPFTSARRVGWLLKRLRFGRGGSRRLARSWIITRPQLDRLALSYGLSAETPQDANIETF
jgi:hypothetical protein